MGASENSYSRSEATKGAIISLEVCMSFRNKRRRIVTNSDVDPL